MYASRDNIVDIWGADFLGDILPEDVDSVIAADRALQLATDEVDTYLSARYALPLATSPAVLVGPTVDIAVYKLANRHASLTNTIEDRYEHAIKLLERIADGKAGLGADEPSISTGHGASTPDGAWFQAERRKFGGDLL